MIIKINQAIEPIIYYHSNDKDSYKFFIRINNKIDPVDQPLLKKSFSRKPFFEEIQDFIEKISDYQESLLESSSIEGPRIL